MPPASSLTALLDSPAPSNDDTILGGGRTLPDVTLGSLGSSFRSEDEDERRARLDRPAARGKCVKGRYHGPGVLSWCAVRQRKEIGIDIANSTPTTHDRLARDVQFGIP